MTVTKYSRQREVLLAVLQQTNIHPNADWIYDQVRREIPNVSLGTVYRNLSKLAADGTIRKIEVGDGCDHYDGNLSPHAHLYCRKCRGISDVFINYGVRLKDEAQQMTAAQIHGCSVVFDGVCKKCLGDEM